MNQTSFVRRAVVVIGLSITANSASAQIQNFRVTEVDPSGDQVEVTNFGPAHTTVRNRPFCHRLDYASIIATGNAFAANEARIFPVTQLNDTDSDFWLYLDNYFGSGFSILHGVKYGPQPNVGRTALAGTVGLWPSGGTAFSPAPPAGMTLAWDTFGFSPFDWYIDETPTLGAADSTTPSTVPTSLQHPAGTQDFESVLLGDELIAITNWFDVNTAATGMFTIRSVGDVQGVTTTRNGSTRWLRIRDQDDVGTNRFYGPAIFTPQTLDYRWTFHINLEETPPGAGATAPRITIQHEDTGFQNAWGIEFTDQGANLVVTGIGGTAASTPIYALASPTGVGDWVKLDLEVSFASNTLTAFVNDVNAGTLPIALNPSADASQFRFCYRGEGAGNVNTMLLDDVSVNSCLGLSLDGAPSPAFAGDNLILAVCGGAPNSPGLMYVTQVNGTPSLGLITPVNLDAAGTTAVMRTVPANTGLPGNSLTMQVFTLNGAVIEASNETTVDFQ